MSTDVIAQFNSDGTIIPLRLRVHTPDGERTYTIQRFEDYSAREARTIAGVYVDGTVSVWKCGIEDFGRRRDVWLFFNRGQWKMRA